MPKAYFSGDTLLIHVSVSVTEIDTQADLYSDWKEWKSADDNTKYPQAFRTIGGDSIGGGREAGDYYFLMNGWQIKSWSGNHELTVTGNLYANTSGATLFDTVSGAYNVAYFLERSQLTQSIETGSGLSDAQDERLQEIWTIQGLDSTIPVSTTASAIRAGASIEVTMSGDPNIKIVSQRT